MSNGSEFPQILQLNILAAGCHSVNTAAFLIIETTINRNLIKVCVAVSQYIYIYIYIYIYTYMYLLALLTLVMN